MLTTRQLADHIQRLQSQYDRDFGVLCDLQIRYHDTGIELDQVREQIRIGEQVQLLFGRTSQFAREQIKTHVERTVTAALQAVFGKEMRFEIVLREVGGQTAAEWNVIDQMGGDEVAGDPESCRGGGVVDIVSLALRLAMLELVRPRPEGPILLDEVGKHVSAEHRVALGEFLRAYAQRVGRQILLVTHAEELAALADVAYRVERRDGVSEVRRV